MHIIYDILDYLIHIWFQVGACTESHMFFLADRPGWLRLRWLHCPLQRETIGRSCDGLGQWTCCLVYILYYIYMCVGDPSVSDGCPWNFFFCRGVGTYLRFPSLWTPICRPRLWWLHPQWHAWGRMVDGLGWQRQIPVQWLGQKKCPHTLQISPVCRQYRAVSFLEQS